MRDYEVVEVTMYDESKRAISMFSSNEVIIIGEQLVMLNDGRIVEQYIYNMPGYVPNNGKPFVSLKSNLVLM